MKIAAPQGNVMLDDPAAVFSVRLFRTLHLASVNQKKEVCVRKPIPVC
jgi:hypothetical protein